MGWDATRWSRLRPVVAVLDSTQRHILTTAAISCIDATGWLAWERFDLAEGCAVAERSLERHLPKLAKLEYLVRGDKGFRLARYLRDRQNGGIRPQFAEKEKESTKEKEKALGDSTDLSLRDKSSSLKTRALWENPTMHAQVLAVLALFEALPGTSPANPEANQVEAELWLREGFSLPTIGAALVLGLTRHIASGRATDPEAVQSLRFFREVVWELRERDPELFRRIPAGRFAAVRLAQLPGMARRKREFYERIVRAEV
jgi:hypothetical protein